MQHGPGIAFAGILGERQSMPSRILVTGASGFIGSALVSTFLAAGHEVRAASRRRVQRVARQNLEWVSLADLTGEIDWSFLLDGIDVVIHTAAIVHSRHVKEEDWNKVNRLATAKLSRSCAEKGIKRLVFISSIAAQTGPSADHILTETDEPCPTSVYGRTKLAAEVEIRNSGVPFTILRPVAVYGPGAKGNVALVVKISTLALPLPFGALHNRRSLLSIDNLLQAILLCVDGWATKNETFIVSDRDGISVAEIFIALREGRERLSGSIFPLSPILLKSLAYAAGRGAWWDSFGRELLVSSQKLQNVGWKPLIDTKNGLRNLLRIDHY